MSSGLSFTYPFIEDVLVLLLLGSMLAADNEMVNQKRHGPFPLGANRLIGDTDIHLIKTNVNTK